MRCGADGSEATATRSRAFADLGELLVHAADLYRIRPDRLHVESAVRAPSNREVDMYKTKPCFACNMPSEAPLNVLALNASLKHDPLLSNTGELASLVLEEMRALAPNQHRHCSSVRRDSAGGTRFS